MLSWSRIAVMATLLLVLSGCGSDPSTSSSTVPIATTRATTTTRAPATTTTESPQLDPEDAALAQEAMERNDAFYVAVNAGDIAAMPDILGQPLSEADTRHWEFHADFTAAGTKWVAEDCRVKSVIGSLVSGECRLEYLNPVFVATGASSVIAPFQLRGAGGVFSTPSWISLGTIFDGRDGPLRAMVDYMQKFYPDEYPLCDPHEVTGEFTEHGGIPRVPECSAVLAPRLADIAAWVEAGRPDNWGG
jgi:hypothetical protein